MSTFNLFFESLQNSLTKDEFVKLTLSKPVRKSEGLLNVYVRLFEIDGQSIFQMKYRYASEYQYKQLSIAEVISELEGLLLETFRMGTLFTLSQDLLVLVSKKKAISYRDTAPSFKNKLPDVPLGS